MGEVPVSVLWRQVAPVFRRRSADDDWAVPLDDRFSLLEQLTSRVAALHAVQLVRIVNQVHSDRYMPY